MYNTYDTNSTVGYMRITHIVHTCFIFVYTSIPHIYGTMYTTVGHRLFYIAVGFVGYKGLHNNKTTKDWYSHITSCLCVDRQQPAT